ncbi:uncharacterized protein LOC18422600 [Amborella trichopoda]|nr:uncharacterized protein LOC18422600 [Amborella trichopoda]XP_020522911.1 uncharacterized protein LOC18422600 [Amborella trichopoda]XP_020522917.1 uncharacterized protein LOC18422600 [Amborella trichopoda]|eukprot:XP_020522905.1 uncharacterized protein LOC18422600 [Amborella trichopoda]
MDNSFFEMDSIKAEKASAMTKYKRIQKIGTFFRFLEVFVVLALFSWFSSSLPIAARIAVSYFRYLCLVAVSPTFVFILGNAIVITLVAKSGHFGPRASSNSCPDIYDEFVTRSESRRFRDPQQGDNRRVIDESSPAIEAVPGEIVYEDKAVCEEKLTSHPCTDKHTDSDKQGLVYRRSRSEKTPEEGGNGRKSGLKLQRSETEILKGEKPFGRRVDGSDFDKYSQEEFKLTIDTFIAEKLRIQREESMAMVLKNVI